MRHDQDTLIRLAENRRRRMGADGRPRLELTDADIERSTTTAMRLAEASKSQVEARDVARHVLPA